MDFYIPVDKRIRTQLSSGDNEALLHNITAATSRIVRAELSQTDNKLNELQVSLGQNNDSACLIERLQDALSSKLRDVQDCNRQDFLASLTHHLRNVDNDRVQQKLDAICAAQADLKDIKQSVQLCPGPIKQILDQVTVHKSGRAANIGHDAEQRFQLMLTESFPEHAVDSVAGTSHKGDFVLAKESLPDILLELKSWETNVKSRDVLKFERDVQNNCKHGIMVSMRSGVVNRRDFEFKILDNRYVALYLCNTDWDATRLKAAVNLIYSLEDMMRVTDRDGNIAFPDDVIASLNSDIQDYDNKVKDCIVQLDKTKSLLTSIMLDSIRTRLATGIRTLAQPPAPDPTKVIEGQCSFCRQIRASWHDRSNLNAHVKTCMAKVMQDKQREYDAEALRRKSKDKQNDESGTESSACRSSTVPPT